jgi:hypothetical protein
MVSYVTTAMVGKRDCPRGCAAIVVSASHFKITMLKVGKYQKKQKNGVSIAIRYCIEEGKYGYDYGY